MSILETCKTIAHIRSVIELLAQVDEARKSTEPNPTTPHAIFILYRFYFVALGNACKCDSSA